jgi:hypothetical protein
MAGSSSDENFISPALSRTYSDDYLTRFPLAPTGLGEKAAPEVLSETPCAAEPIARGDEDKYCHAFSSMLIADISVPWILLPWLPIHISVLYVRAFDFGKIHPPGTGRSAFHAEQYFSYLSAGPALTVISKGGQKTFYPVRYLPAGYRRLESCGAGCMRDMCHER